MVAFFLGSHPTISLNEIDAVCNAFSSKKSQETVYPYIVTYDIPSQDAISIYNRLGGSTRVGEVIAQFSRSSETNVHIKEFLTKYLETNEIKRYVVSLFGIYNRDINKYKLIPHIREHIRSKYAGKDSEDRHSSTTVYYLLRRKGAEICIVASQTSITIIRTLAAQDPNYWNTIDFEKPNRKKEIGMLPSKLARIMLNIAALQPDNIVWDPFVGQGTVVQQAYLLGLTPIGSDVSKEALELTKENHDWFVKRGLLAMPFSSVSENFFAYDITTTQKPPISNIDAIVGEPFLGHMRSRPFANKQEAAQHWNSLVLPLYRAMLEKSAQMLTSGKRLVFVKPLYPYLEKNNRLWYNTPVDIQSKFWKRLYFSKNVTDSMWVQNDSTIGRELYVLERIKGE